MRLDLSEEGWGFGSRHLALLTTVLACATLGTLTLSTWLYGGEVQASSVGDLRLSVSIPSVEYPVSEDARNLPLASHIAQSREVDLQRKISKSGLSLDTILKEEKSSKPEENKADQVSKVSGEEAPLPLVVIPHSSTRPLWAQTEQTEQTQQTQQSAVKPSEAPKPPVVDRTDPSRVDRRETRQEAVQAADALKDLRPR